MKEVFRTEIEEMMLQDMVVEDAKFLLLGDDENEVDSVISNTSLSLFGDDDSVSSDDLMDDDDDYLDEEDI